MLDSAGVSRAGDAPETWEKVARKLRTREMPPPGAPRPDDAAYRSLIATLETTLDAAAEAAPNPGRVPVHRLNRTEYTNAVRDLLALEVDGRSLIADEPDSHGFDNVASVLTVSPALLESYLSAASTVSRLAVGDPALNPVVDTFKVPTAMVQDDRASDRQPFGSRGGTTIRYHFPLDGEYTIKVVLKRQLYLYLIGMGEPHQIDLRLDGALLKRFTIGGEGKGHDRAGELRRQHAGRSATGKSTCTPRTRASRSGCRSKRGRARWACRSSASYWEPEGVLQPPQRGFARTTNELYFGEPGVDSGAGRRSVQGASARRTRRAAGRSSSAGRRRPRARPRRRAPRRILSTLARRAYRRPVTDAEVNDAARLLQGRAAPTATSTLGIQRGASSHPVGAGVPVSRRARARRRRSGPGAAVSSGSATSTWRRGCRSSSGAASRTTNCWTWPCAARSSDPAVLERQVRRMLRDSRSQALVDNFAYQWLKLGRLAGVVPDVDEFPDFDENLREALQQETRLFVASQLREDRSVIELV